MNGERSFVDLLLPLLALIPILFAVRDLLHDILGIEGFSLAAFLALVPVVAAALVIASHAAKSGGRSLRIIPDISALAAILRRWKAPHPHISVDFERGEIAMRSPSGEAVSIALLEVEDKAVAASRDFREPTDTEKMQRLSRFFHSLQRSNIPFAYLLIASPTDKSEEIASGRLLIATWASDAEGFEKASAKLETNIAKLESSFFATFPDLGLERVKGLRLFEVVQDPVMSLRRGRLGFSLDHLSTLGNIFSKPMLSDAKVVEPNFELPAPKLVSEEGPLLGYALHRGQEIYPVRIALEDLKTHAVIFGATGTGKSTTASTLVKGLVDMGIPVLVIDWHSEYRSLMLDLNGLVFTPGKQVSELVINVLDPALSQDLVEHISLVTDIFSDIFGFTAPQSFMFREALRKVYEKSGYFSGRRGTPPTLSELVQQIERTPSRSVYDNEIKLALLRRLKPLVEGQAGRALNGQSTISVEELFGKPVSIELGHFKEESVRAMFTNILLKMLFDYRSSRHTEKLTHVTVVEEARHVVPFRRPEDPPHIAERMVGELRKYGEGMIFVCQFPSQISPEILKNSSTRIVHAIRTDDDRRVLSGALGLTQAQADYIRKLEVGKAVVLMPKVPSPFPVKVLMMHDGGPVDDALLKKVMSKRLHKPVDRVAAEEKLKFSTALLQKIIAILKNSSRPLTLEEIALACGSTSQNDVALVEKAVERLVENGAVELLQGEEATYYRLSEAPP